MITPTFHTPTQLQTWLQEQGINLSQWGQADAKTIASLWEELQHGDCVLQADPPLRISHIAQIIISRGEKLLIEAEQELGDGRSRSRLIPPSEKMRPGEDIAAAAWRCLQEELNVEPGEATLHLESYRQRIRELDSLSYPGLRTRYIFHRLNADVPGLPNEDFWRDNQAFSLGDPVRRQRWSWRSGVLSPH